jgi:hypothetical protein
MIYSVELTTRSRYVATLKIEQMRGYWKVSSDGESWTLDGRMALHQVIDHEAYKHGKNDNAPLLVSLKRW